MKPSDRPEAIIITHGDVDGMVCAAQLIRREDPLHSGLTVFQVAGSLLFGNRTDTRASITSLLKTVQEPSAIERLMLRP